MGAMLGPCGDKAGAQEMAGLTVVMLRLSDLLGIPSPRGWSDPGQALGIADSN